VLFPDITAIRGKHAILERTSWSGSRSESGLILLVVDASPEWCRFVRVLQCARPGDSEQWMASTCFSTETVKVRMEAIGRRPRWRLVFVIPSIMPPADF
jgi:hypothetical protein